MTGTPLHESCVPDTHAPNFDADWHRRVFGVAVALSEFGHYPWSAFQEQLITAIAGWESTSESERDSWQYYEHWLTALERVLAEHGLVKPDELRDLPGETSRIGRAKSRIDMRELPALAGREPRASRRS